MQPFEIVQTPESFAAVTAEAFCPTSKKNANSDVSFWKAARALSTPRHPLAFSKQFKFFLRCCRHRAKMKSWLSRLAEPDLAAAYKAQPRLGLKPHLAFVNYKWSIDERCAQLRDHYDIIPQLIAPALLEETCKGHFDFLHIVNTTTNRRLIVRFFYKDKYEREGDLTLNLIDAATDLTLTNLTFSIGKDAQGDRRIYIGGLQACPDPRVRSIIHDLAKEMYGMRAKALLLWTLQQLAASWDVASIYAIDDAHHISNYRDKHHKVSTSYDEFWAESEGEHQQAVGFWTLPLQPRQRAREELKANKRKQYERRYALLADIQASLQIAAGRCMPAGHAVRLSKQETDAVEFFYASPVPASVTAASGEAECTQISSANSSPSSDAVLA